MLLVGGKINSTNDPSSNRSISSSDRTSKITPLAPQRLLILPLLSKGPNPQSWPSQIGLSLWHPQNNAFLAKETIHSDILDYELIFEIGSKS